MKGTHTKKQNWIEWAQFTWSKTKWLFLEWVAHVLHDSKKYLRFYAASVWLLLMKGSSDLHQLSCNFAAYFNPKGNENLIMIWSSLKILFRHFKRTLKLYAVFDCFCRELIPSCVAMYLSFSSGKYVPAEENNHFAVYSYLSLSWGGGILPDQSLLVGPSLGDSFLPDSSHQKEGPSSCLFSASWDSDPPCKQTDRHDRKHHPSSY